MSRTASENSIVLPEESVAPEVGSGQDYVDLPDNLAGDEELAKRISDVMWRDWQRFDSQETRRHWVDRIIDNDRMYRCSDKRVSGKAARQTVSNVTDTGFRRRIDTIHANEMSVLIPDDGLPAFYEVGRADDSGSSGEEAERVIDDRNALEVHYWEEDNRVAKIRAANMKTNKDENCIVSMEWCREVRTEKVRVVSERDPETGEPTKFSFEETTEPVKDCPSFDLHDPKDVWFDTTVKDAQQTPWIKRRDVLLDELYAQQEAGNIANVGKITSKQLADGHDISEADLEDERNLNAGQATTDDEPNGLIRIYDFWARLPIDDKGKWAPGKVLPRIFWCTFAGRIDGEKVPLRIQKNPYNHGMMPFLILHSHRDDRGIIHDGLGTAIEGLWDEANTNINQAVDNKTARNRPVWVAKGHWGTRDLTLRGGYNKVLKAGVNGSMDQLMPQDTTQTTMAFSDRLEDLMDKVAGTDKPIAGEALGSRTSATEAKNIFDQAVKAPLAKVQYWAEDQLFPWMLKMDASLSDQFADPSLTIKVLGREIRPARLYGPFGVRVTVVTEHANNALARQQMAAWVQNDLPILAPYMSPEGPGIAGEKAARSAGFSAAESQKMFGTKNLADSVNQAREEAWAILEEGALIQPDPEQNLEVHVQVKSEILQQLKDLQRAGDPDADPQRIALLEAHINQLKQMQAQQSAQAQQTAANIPAQQDPTQGQPSTFVGENTGDLIAAQEGAVAQ